MRHRNLVILIFFSGILAIGSPAFAFVSKNAAVGAAFSKWHARAGSGPHAESHVIHVKRKRRRRVRIRLPLGPSYIYRDYPYYYSRGFYPTHIGGYIYYPHVPIFYSRHPNRCSKRHRDCTPKMKRKKRYRPRQRKRRK